MFSDKRYNPYYTIGLVMGMAQFSFDRMVKSCVTKSGKDFSVQIELTENDKESYLLQLRKSVDKSLQAVIDEKMKHRYYLN
jgi:hypothetical protein